MGYSGLKTGMKGNLQHRHHIAVQPYTAIPKLARASLGPQSACTDHHCAWKKQLTKSDHLSLADFNIVQQTAG